jgi:hypothetical protein
MRAELRRKLTVTAKGQAVFRQNTPEAYGVNGIVQVKIL